MGNKLENGTVVLVSHESLPVEQKSKLRTAAQSLAGVRLSVCLCVVCPHPGLPETAQPLRQEGCASQIISNGATAVARKDHHVLSTIRRRRRASRVEGSSARRAEAAGAQVLVAGN